MPLMTEPGRKFKVVLKCDEEKPEGEQPRFIFRAISAREWGEIADKDAQIDKLPNETARIKALFDLFRRYLIDWENMTDPTTNKPLPFEPDNIEEWLTLPEATELLIKFRNQGIGATERKN